MYNLSSGGDTMCILRNGGDTMYNLSTGGDTMCSLCSGNTMYNLKENIQATGLKRERTKEFTHLGLDF